MNRKLLSLKRLDEIRRYNNYVTSPPFNHTTDVTDLLGHIEALTAELRDTQGMLDKALGRIADRDEQILARDEAVKALPDGWWRTSNDTYALCRVCHGWAEVRHEDNCPVPAIERVRSDDGA